MRTKAPHRTRLRNLEYHIGLLCFGYLRLSRAVQFHQLTASARPTYTSRGTMVLIGITALGTANCAHRRPSILGRIGGSREVTASLTSIYGLAGSNATVWRVAARVHE